MNRNNQDDIDWGSWIFTAIMLAACWPIGLILLFRQLMGYTRKGRRVKKHPYDIQREQQNAQAQYNQYARYQTVTPTMSGHGMGTAVRRGGWEEVKKTTPVTKKEPKKAAYEKGLGLTILGGVLAGVFGAAILGIIGDSWRNWGDILSDLFLPLGFFGSGLVCLYAGRQQQKKAKRFKKYLAYIGRNTEISISALASAMGKKEKVVYDDLQDMLDDGVLPMGYIDVSTGTLVLSDAGITERVVQPEPEPDPVKVEEDENAILQEIREVNDAIPDEVMSAKIDRIGEITGKILDYQRSHPGKSGQLRSFLNYYLPTTLKVLRAYAQLDAQGIEGENITAAKKRIESMMDQVVDGFEKQLDKLFADDALDIASDVEVLENMLRKDGLSSGGMTFESAVSPVGSSGFSAQQTYLDLQKVANELDDRDQGGQGLTLGG